MTEENQVHPEIAEVDWIDDAFHVEQKKWGTWESFDKTGKGIVTSLNKENCITATRFYLKGVQDGWENVESTQHEGTVGGKL